MLVAQEALMSTHNTPPSPNGRQTRAWLTVLGTRTMGGMTAMVGTLLLAAPGCTTTTPQPNPVQAATQPDDPAPPASTTSGGKTLPDLTKEFSSGECEEIKGAKVPGADSYFHGHFKIAGDAVSGHETWWLHANETWTQKGGNSCTIGWQGRGTKGEPGACRDCDFALQLTASPETGNSKCPEELLKREARSQDLRYDVKLSSNGEAFVYFSKSGTLLGQGFHKDGEIVYRTQHQCKWF
jgi:hypothetical protein